jgi:hypothetical protein
VRRQSNPRLNIHLLISNTRSCIHIYQIALIISGARGSRRRRFAGQWRVIGQGRGRQGIVASCVKLEDS